MADDLFDPHLQWLRRNRAERQGFRTFLHERAIDDLLDRLVYVQRRFRNALVVGCPPGPLRDQLGRCAGRLRFADRVENAGTESLGQFDLCIIVGVLDTANDVQLTLRLLGAMLQPDALLLGAFAGNDSFPVLRAAMLAADQATGLGASPRVHPRIDAASVASLLQAAGFVMPVIDIDRVRLRYRRLTDLVADLRGMGATNALVRRSRTPLTRTALAAAASAFDAAGDGSATTETVELVHFAAWTPR
ncbi:SAM-dependent methyltransferase [Sphingomonas sp. GCM10030256]|uniref:SAM-dependent methyltransferase n=1 Tax=Sphingomonas sp. GCM10030256 TaxID=3273427 RepID=UPI003612D2A3